MYYESDYLKHHGVKGQQWGVRRGPPYPIEDKVMKKGSKLNSVYVSNKKHNDKSLLKKKEVYTYNPEDKHDADIYKGPFAMYLTGTSAWVLDKYIEWGMSSTKTSVRECKFETIKDLKMPTSKERRAEFDALMTGKHSSKYIKELESVQDFLKKRYDGYEEALSPGKRNILTADIKNDPTGDAAYNAFNTMMEARNAYGLTRDYMKNIESKYDAMVDDNNATVYNDAHDPVIVFNPKKALQIVEESNNLTISEIKDSYERVKKKMNAKGASVAL